MRMTSQIGTAHPLIHLEHRTQGRPPRRARYAAETRAQTPSSSFANEVLRSSADGENRTFEVTVHHRQADSGPLYEQDIVDLTSSRRESTPPSAHGVHQGLGLLTTQPHLPNNSQFPLHEPLIIPRPGSDPMPKTAVALSQGSPAHSAVITFGHDRFDLPRVDQEQLKMTSMELTTESDLLLFPDSRLNDKVPLRDYLLAKNGPGLHAAELTLGAEASYQLPLNIGILAANHIRHEQEQSGTNVTHVQLHSFDLSTVSQEQPSTYIDMHIAGLPGPDQNDSLILPPSDTYNGNKQIFMAYIVDEAQRIIVSLFLLRSL